MIQADNEQQKGKKNRKKDKNKKTVQERKCNHNALLDSVAVHSSIDFSSCLIILSKTSLSTPILFVVDLDVFYFYMIFIKVLAGRGDKYVCSLSS